MVMPAVEALHDEVERLKAEEAASATRAERAADPSLRPQPAPAAEAGASQARAAMESLSNLPPEVATPILVVGLDLVGRRVAAWTAGPEAAERYALTEDERKLLVEVWLPVVRLYLPQLAVHPLVAAGGVTGLVYAMKALPEGGLEALLGGKGGAAAPRAAAPAAPPATPEQVLNQEEPDADAVLGLVAQQQAELKRAAAEKSAEVPA